MYTSALIEFTASLKRAIETSIETKGIDAGDQKYWATVLLTNICSIASSILFICPRSILNERGLSWSLESVAALARSVFEGILMVFYLGLEPVPTDEWKVRITLVHLADCTERIRLFTHLGDQETVARFVGTAVDLRSRLTANPAFAAMGKKNEYLSGERATLFGKAEIIKRMQEDSEDALYFYRFMSNYLHSLPFGFHRTGEHKRDGTENEVDKFYIAMTLQFTAKWLDRITAEFQKAFANCVTYGKGGFDFRVMTIPAFSKREQAMIDRVFSAKGELAVVKYGRRW